MRGRGFRLRRAADDNFRWSRHRKTSIIIAILKVLIRMGLPAKEIALAAPTGKAAYRIGESIRENISQLERPGGEMPNELLKPSTVHRLLGYSPTMRRFRQHRNNPLAARVVIVDEGSMLDLDLMARSSTRCVPARGWCFSAMPTNFHQLRPARCFAI